MQDAFRFPWLQSGFVSDSCRVGNFKYAILNCKGAKGVAMATKIRQKRQNCTNLYFLPEISEFFACIVGF